MSIKCLNQSFGLNLSKGLPNRCTVGSKWDHWRVFYNHESQMSCSSQLESENKIKKEKLSKPVLWLHFVQGSPNGCTVGPKWGRWRVFCNHVARCLVPRNLSPKKKENNKMK